MPEAFRSYKPGYMQVYGCICLDELGNVLLVRGRGSQKWSFPKGHKNLRESSLDCAKRELLEETGILAPSKCAGYYKMKGGEYYVYYIDSTTILCIKDIVEIDMITWFPLNDIPVQSNIDVSIFKSHLNQSFPPPLRNIIPLKIREYICSEASLRKVRQIQQKIRDN
jgi:8-oxo-dGTP pyrophosphatase MutT (NUDIX family)